MRFKKQFVDPLANKKKDDRERDRGSSLLVVRLDRTQLTDTSLKHRKTALALEDPSLFLVWQWQSVELLVSWSLFQTSRETEGTTGWGCLTDPQQD